MKRFLALIGAGLTLSSVPTAHAQATPDTAAVRTALNAMITKYSTAAIAGDVATITSLFTDDAHAVYAGFPTASGRAAIQATYEAFFKANKIKVWDETLGTVNAPSADIVSAGGTVHQFGDQNGKPFHAWWRWSAAYKKGSDGQWRIWYVIAFPDSTKKGK